MAEIVYPTEFTSSGPWELSRVDLEALDPLIGTAMADLTKHRKNLIEDFVRRSRKPHEPKSALQDDDEINDRAYAEGRYGSPSATVVATLKNNRLIRGTSIADVLSNPEVEDEIIQQLVVKIKKDSASLQLEVKMERNRMSIDLSAADSTVGPWAAAYDSFRNWARDREPTPFRRFVSEHIEPATVIFWALLVLGCVQAIVTSDTAKSDQKNAAQELLVGGLHQEELLRAAELTLQIVSEYKPPVKGELPVPPWAWIVRAVCLWFLVAAFTRPRTTINVGAGHRRFKLLRASENLWWRIVPGVAASAFVLPWIYDAIRR
jgi:hypothetical protein